MAAPAIYTAPAKINIFLKITGFEAGYHQIASRFMLQPQLHDRLWLERGDGKALSVVGDFDCPPEENTIVKAFRALLESYPDKELAQFGRLHKVVVYKNIPAFAGLGGGSSNAATFLDMVNQTLGMGLSKEALMDVGAKVGSDVPFFLSGHTSANVTGRGEVIEGFDEEPLFMEFYHPDIRCGTGTVYHTFRRFFARSMEGNRALAETLLKMPSREILAQYDEERLNDLLPAALKAYPELFGVVKQGWFMTGSGSTFFTPKKEK